MLTRVKICGITRVDDALLSAELGAAALGFNFYPQSPRYIEPARAVEIIRQLPPFVTAVGVFADEPEADQILAVARESNIGAIQVRGPRLPPTGDLLMRYPVILAVPVHPDSQALDLAGFQATAYLLDAYDQDLLGGTGKTFDWNLAKRAGSSRPIIVAGGLKPENVGRAIREARPFAVDVASGVESAPGVKDALKLRAFFAAVADADKTV